MRLGPVSVNGSCEPMNYLSTRGAAPEVGFAEATLAGLAPDGGLYMPVRWPSLSAEDFSALAGMPYEVAAERVIAPFVGDALQPAELKALIADSYAPFDHPARAPLVQLDAGLWMLELFHGPTLAFKDFALQLLGRLLDHLLAQRDARATIIGATSGDTGSAAIHACKDRERLDIFILHPRGRVSDVQRRQMTTVTAANVYNIAIDGTFDDCQALVKAMLNDPAFRAEKNLASINSINWARVMAQIVYYVVAAVALGAPARKVAFCVPTGNFGDVFAGYAAAQMGLPVAGLRVATNRNDILHRALAGGAYHTGTVSPTVSPSMDIQVASNFERLLFEIHGRDGAAVAALMKELATRGGFDIAPEPLNRARRLFDSLAIDEDRTLAEIARVYAETGRLIDPHTAVAVAAARVQGTDPSVPRIVLATAHPAKFPDAVHRASGRVPEAPPALDGLDRAQERYVELGRDLAAIQAYIRSPGSHDN